MSNLHSGAYPHFFQSYFNPGQYPHFPLSAPTFPGHHSERLFHEGSAYKTESDLKAAQTSDYDIFRLSNAERLQHDSTFPAPSMPHYSNLASTTPAWKHEETLAPLPHAATASTPAKGDAKEQEYRTRTRPKKKCCPVPTEQKDRGYWEKRNKNNESAKRSREIRRQKAAVTDGKLRQMREMLGNARKQLEILKVEKVQLEGELSQFIDSSRSFAS